MSLIVGDADLNTGCAGAIFTTLKTLPGAQATGLDSAMAKFANAIAAGLIPYLVANTVVSPLPAMAAPPGGGPVVGAGTIT